jgi:hypothetical protein
LRAAAFAVLLTAFDAADFVAVFAGIALALAFLAAAVVFDAAAVFEVALARLVVLLAAADRFAVVLLVARPVVFDAADRFVAVLFAAVRLAVRPAFARVPVAFVPGRDALLRDDPAVLRDAVDRAVPFARAVVLDAAAAADDAGSSRTAEAIFLVPAMTSLKPWPGRNAGTEVFLTFTASPVRGLRAVRALRTRFSKTPKPVIATRSPLATARWISSTTLSSAAVATLRSPRRVTSVSMSSALFTVPLPGVLGQQWPWRER